jgi:23S rRNA (adenine-N6)-dimethyltransferase
MNRDQHRQRNRGEPSQGGGRTSRDNRRRTLGQNFLNSNVANDFVQSIDIQRGGLIVEAGAGRGAITKSLLQTGASVIAVELDPVWAKQLRNETSEFSSIKVVQSDILKFKPPSSDFRVVGNIPFGNTTDILRKFLDDPNTAPTRIDLIVQWEVALKRCHRPASTLLSTIWSPWWDTRLGQRIPSSAFKPRPKTDAGILSFIRRDPPLLPPSIATEYASFVRKRWPFKA